MMGATSSTWTVRAIARARGRAVRLLALALLAAAASCSRAREATGAAASRWEVLALEYAYSPSYKHAALVRDAPADARVPLSWYAWLIRSPQPSGRRILVDTGFVEPPRRKPQRFRPVDRLLGELGVAPQSITDVVLTHLHFDHAGNLPPFSRARVWLQRRSKTWAAGRVSDAKPKVGGLRIADLRAVEAAEAAGRLALISGRREIAPGVILHEGGGHAPGMQWVEVRTGGPAGTIVLASDNADRYENLERRVAGGVTAHPDADLALYDEMQKLASRPELVIPGHDPRVGERFRRVAPGVVAIE